MRIFIGTDETQMLGARVFEYSVRKHATLPAVFDTMQQVQAPMPKDLKNQPRTHFSFSRFAIPQLAGYQGRAVYVDADMLVLRDFRELWETPFEGATVLYARPSTPRRPKQFSVMLLDCDRLRWNLEAIVAGLDAGDYDYQQLMGELCIEPAERVRPALPPEWNSLEAYVPGQTALIHYTDMFKQPWVSLRNRHVHLWVGYLREALDDGFITMEEVRREVERGHARPSLLSQLQLSRRWWPLFKWTTGRLQDSSYQPHRTLAPRLKQLKRA
jgi:hypothetical protein